MLELRWVLLALGIIVVAGIYVWGLGRGQRKQPRRARYGSREEPSISLENDLLVEPIGGSGVDPLWRDDRVGAGEPAESFKVDESPETEQRPARATRRWWQPTRRHSVLPDEPATDEDAAEIRDANAAVATDTDASESASEEIDPVPSASMRAPEKIVTLRLVPRQHELPGDEVVYALREAGLQHGRYGIFHKYTEDERKTVFSVASLTEPGSFDLASLCPVAGLSFFVALPGPDDPVAAFDSMVETARGLARALGADLFDDRGSSWSIQREHYVREELISYRHQHSSH